jgi:hypothetical protein
MRLTDERLQRRSFAQLFRDLLLLPLDLGLLVPDCVHEHCGQLVVLDAFDLALVVAEGEQRLD